MIWRTASLSVAVGMRMPWEEAMSRSLATHSGTLMSMLEVYMREPRTSVSVKTGINDTDDLGVVGSTTMVLAG